MSVIFILILVSLCVAGSFLGLFIWANKSGQFDDTITPSMRMLFDDKNTNQNSPNNKINVKKKSV